MSRTPRRVRRGACALLAWARGACVGHWRSVPGKVKVCVCARVCACVLVRVRLCLSVSVLLLPGTASIAGATTPDYWRLKLGKSKSFLRTNIIRVPAATCLRKAAQSEQWGLNRQTRSNPTCRAGRGCRGGSGGTGGSVPPTTEARVEQPGKPPAWCRARSATAPQQRLPRGALQSAARSPPRPPPLPPVQSGHVSSITPY